MIIRLRRIQRSHSITSATLMSPTVSCFLLHCTDSYNHAIGVVHAAFSVSVCAHAHVDPSMAAFCYTRRRPRRRIEGSLGIKNSPRWSTELRGFIVLHYWRFNWRSNDQAPPPREMNYHCDTHVFTHDKDIYIYMFHVVNPPPPV